MKEIQSSHFRTVPSSIAIELPQAAIAEFCQRWKIQEFYLFGSVLRSDFRPDSDIDVLVSFAPDAHRVLYFHNFGRVFTLTSALHSQPTSAG